jgi:hypothetical protein
MRGSFLSSSIFVIHRKRQTRPITGLRKGNAGVHACSHRERSSRYLPLTLLLLSLPSSLAAIQAIPAGIKWRVKAAGDEPFKRGSKLTVTVQEGKVLCETRGRHRSPTVTIPTNRVTVFSDSVISGVLTDKVFAEDELDYASQCGDGTSIDNANKFALCADLGLAKMLLLSPLLVVLDYTSFEDHFVHITWKDQDGKSRRITFKVEKKDYALFLANLRTQIGQGLQEDPAEHSIENLQPLDEFLPSQIPAESSRCVVLAPDASEFSANCTPNLLFHLNQMASAMPSALSRPPSPN